MKQYIFLLFLLFIFTSCGGSSNDTTSSNIETTADSNISRLPVSDPVKAVTDTTVQTPAQTLSQIKQDAADIIPVEASDATQTTPSTSIVTSVDEAVRQQKKSVTIYVHGYDDKGVTYDTTYGYDAYDPLLDRLVTLTGFDTLLTYDPENFSDIVTITPYYGANPPDYYDGNDIADIEEVTKTYGGGIPRYAMIVAKYARHVMELTGAEQVNFVSASMGSLVTRWLVEKDLEHLASEKKIAKWYSLEGVIRGNKMASNKDLVKYANTFEKQPIDVTHMSYQWIEANLHKPKSEMASAYYGSIETIFESSTKASDPFGWLMPKTPNDGYQAVADTYFATFLPQTKYKGYAPAHTYFHQTHLGLKKYDGAWASVATFLLPHKRVRVTLTEATVEDIHEKTYYFNKEAEIVFESEVFSPYIKQIWNITDAIDQRLYDSGALPIHKYKKDGETKALNQVIFDGYVLDQTEQLIVKMAAYEVDQSAKYGVHDELGTKAKLGGNTIQIDLQNGNYEIVGKDWIGTISVEIIN